MIKFGGTGKSKQACIKRNCVNKQIEKIAKVGKTVNVEKIIKIAEKIIMVERKPKIERPTLVKEKKMKDEKTKRIVNRFNGMSEEEVAKKGLPDYLKHGLDMVFIGINPSMFAAYTGKYLNVIIGIF